MDDLNGYHQDPTSSLLAQIAAQSAATWHALAARAFPGELSVETDNSVYRFKDSVLMGRSKRGSDAPARATKRGLKLIGFLANEGGFWSLSPRFRPGSHAVLWSPIACASTNGQPDPASFILTSKALAATVPDPQPVPWVSRSAVADRRSAPHISGMYAIARPPRAMRPAPASATRIHAAEARTPH
ncbi:hypothetical protein AKJ09_09813 [Labilithrix luteola]|uniref:Uncharacterized protein n=2 Tax=Labilithrix luteola TaxID=1391654 RepID=A0A0K1QCJ4_9BACT|nr:hypothetical protein AKJ09_09813 [Labilithrix luteola]